MSDENKKNTNGTAAESDDTTFSVRLPECFVLMSGDSEYKGKMQDGKIGFKYGDGKGDWLWISYISMKKLIDFCMRNKVAFNIQLQKEIEKQKVEGL